ncbi:DUF4276 family protein [uncultured Microscilla sp.]|uniref:DUF4276 family protein n=1 Tax=uncultured Microscilla sp. TaxID=432653 RepID=UPI00262BC623|nr:DUF4276 family protein [uncultured Microscilla sp.]
MKRVHCIVEGQTEVKVFSTLLIPYLEEKVGAYVDIRITPIKHTGGGIVKFSKLKEELRNHLLDKGKIVTTFFDYYGIHPNLHFPNYEAAKVKQQNPIVGAKLLEEGMSNYLSEELGLDTRYFIPYIQLHEFEALLFSSSEGFEFQYDDVKILDELQKVRNRFPNPEDINDSPETAPSKRLIKILKANGEAYNKVADGEDIATIVGLDTILQKCPRFKQWISELIAKIQE